MVRYAERIKTLSLISVIAIVFLYAGQDGHYNNDAVGFAYLAGYHSPLDLLHEPDPSGWLVSKSGFIFLLYALVKFFGLGLNSLHLIGLILASILLLFSYISYRILKEIMDREQAFHSSIILLFLPLPLYLAHKTLSEVPALFFGSLGILSFLHTLKLEDRSKIFLFSIVTAIPIFLSFICRLDAPIMYGSFVAALIAVYRNRFDLKKCFLINGIIVLVCLPLFLGYTAFIEISPIDYFLVGPTLMQLKFGVLAVVFEVGLEFMFFMPLLGASIFAYRESQFRFSLIWLILSSLPIFMITSNILTRYLSWNLIPLSVLVYLGIKRTFQKYLKGHMKIVPIFIFALIVLLNIYLIRNLMDYEVNERNLICLLTKIDHHYDQKIILIPWYPDFNFLRFSFPKKPVYLVQTQHLSEDHARRYGGYHIADLAALTTYKVPKLFIGWKVHPPAAYLIDIFDKIGMDYLKKKVKDELKFDHLKVSWMWNDPHLEFTQFAKCGQYTAYVVDILD